MTITLYSSFAKRKNSTKRPTGGTSFTNAVLKENTSVEAPVFVLTTNANNWTYASAFGHYYFITDIVHVTNTLCEIHCACDPMADNKDAITGSTQFVERCATQAYWDTEIIDEMYPVQMDPSIYQDNKSTPFTTGGSASLMLSIKGYDGTAFWSMPRSLFQELGQGLMILGTDQDALWSQFSAGSLYKTYLDPMSYITNARIIPIANTSLISASTSHTLWVGYWSYTETGGVEIFSEHKSQIIYRSQEYTLTFQPRNTLQNNFQNCNKFRQYKLTLPGVGSIDLDANIVLTGNNIKVKFIVDVVGGICYEVSYGAGNIRKDYLSGDISIPFAIHGQTADFSKSIGSGMNVVGGIAGGISTGVGIGAFGGPVGAAIGGAAGGLIGGIMGAGRSISNAGPLFHTQTAGNDGSFARLDANSDIILQETIYHPSSFGINRLGAPCMKEMILSSLSGYVKCQNASVELNCFESERAVVENYMNSGFYIE